VGAKEQSGRTWSSLYLNSRDNQVNSGKTVKKKTGCSISYEDYLPSRRLQKGEGGVLHPVIFSERPKYFCSKDKKQGGILQKFFSSLRLLGK
jgi:hypothetical protein